MNLFEPFRKITDAYKKLEIYISVITFSFGLVATFFTLTRVDMFIENFWIVLNLFIVAFGIFALTFYENWLKKKNMPASEESMFHFYLIILMQFAFGGLFATYFVFYIRSSSISQSWFFLLLLGIALVGNEIWKKHYTRLTFQISVLYVSLFLFFVFLLPVLFHRLGSDLFLASGILGLIIIGLFLFILKKFAREKFQSSHRNIRISLLLIFFLMNIFYFSNIIPPIPLSLKDSGVYHQVSKIEANIYQAKTEEKKWTDYFIRFPIFHKQASGAVYVYSAVFSPIKLDTEIVHQWQYYDEAKKAWVDSSRIVLPISGGRADGFRTYSLKQAIAPGIWRVKVETTRGQILGKINFKIENVASLPDLISKTL